MTSFSRGSPRASPQVGPPPADQVVQHSDLGRTGVEQLVHDRGADRSGTAGDQHRCAGERGWSSSNKLPHLGQPRPD